MRRKTLIKCLRKAKTLKNSLYDYDTQFTSNLCTRQNRNRSTILSQTTDFDIKSGFPSVMSTEESKSPGSHIPAVG